MIYIVLFFSLIVSMQAENKIFVSNLLKSFLCVLLSLTLVYSSMSSSLSATSATGQDKGTENIQK